MPSEKSVKAFKNVCNSGAMKVLFVDPLPNIEGMEKAVNESRYLQSIMQTFMKHGIEVKYYDLNQGDQTAIADSSLAKIVEEFDPDLVGINSNAINYGDIVEQCVSEIKKAKDVTTCFFLF